MECFVARQPIFDRRLDVYAYELLFRSGFDNFCDMDDGDLASSDVLTTSFVLTGLQQLTGGKKASINFTRNLLLQNVATLFPSGLLLVEVLEDVIPDPEVVTACRELRQAGFTILLDDFTADGMRSPLLEVADIVKVDFNAVPPDECEAIPRDLKSLGLAFLAEKVETLEQFAQALDWGYSYFQGYFFSKPVVRSDRTIPGSKLVYLRIMNEVGKPGVGLRDLEDIIKQDVSLSYKLLRFMNSAYFGFHEAISSIRHALTLLGMREIRKWVLLSALSHLAEDKPDELIVTSLIRARMCEHLAVQIGMRNRCPELFLMGMFSLVDAIMDRPLSEILEDLPLGDETKSALLGAENPFRTVLDTLTSYERGDWDRFSELASGLELTEGVMPILYRDSLRWVNQVVRANVRQPQGTGTRT